MSQYTSDETKCDNCLKPIREGDPCTYDTVSMLNFCEPCSPNWQTMLENPANFYNGEDKHGEPIYLTAETAQKLADEHIAKGGALTDKFGLSAY